MRCTCIMLIGRVEQANLVIKLIPDYNRPTYKLHTSYEKGGHAMLNDLLAVVT